MHPSNSSSSSVLLRPSGALDDYYSIRTELKEQDGGRRALMESDYAKVPPGYYE